MLVVTLAGISHTALLVAGGVADGGHRWVAWRLDGLLSVDGFLIRCSALCSRMVTALRQVHPVQPSWPGGGKIPVPPWHQIQLGAVIAGGVIIGTEAR